AAGRRGSRRAEEVAMASRMLRRGLPRVAGGDPWPPAGEVDVADAAVTTAAEPSVAESAPAAAAEPAPTTAAAESAPVAEPVEAPAAVPSPSAISGTGVTARRGLPRTPGGEPWPPADAAAPAAAVAP